MRFLSPRSAPTFGLFCSLLLCATTGRAAGTPGPDDDSNDAETLIRQANELRRQHHDELSLPLFQRAYHISRSPRTAGQLGLCEMAIGYSVEAAKYLREALAAPTHPWVVKNKVTLEKSLAQALAAIGSVTIQGEPSGAEVLANGIVFGRLPLAETLQLNKGITEVEVRAPAYLSARRTFNIAGGETEFWTVVLAPQSPRPQPPSAAISVNTGALAATSMAGGDVAQSVMAEPAQRAEPISSGPLPSRRSSIAKRLLVATTLGLGIAGTAVGAVYGLRSMSQHNDASQICPDTCTSQHGVDLWNQARSSGVVSTAGFAVGAAGLVAGGLIWFLVPEQTIGESPVAVALGFGSLQLRGSW
jgi:hypothetical protein